jgi:pimeloyl-ACP methyl ester carboxylesterase
MRFMSGSWELYAETFGRTGDPAVVLLHGAGNCLTAWDEELCERLAARGRLVVRLDARDAGQSAGSGPDGPDYSLYDMAGDVGALLDTLGLEAAALAGASQGGMVAQIAAFEHPERVAGLVLISTTPGGDGLPGPAEGLFAGGPEAPDWGDRDAVVRYIVEIERPYGAERFDEALMTRIAARTFDHARDLPAQFRNPYAVDPGPPYRPRLGEIRAPTVVVHGTADPMFPPAHGHVLAAEIPGARLLEVEGFGHATLPRDEWPRLVDAISSLPAPRSPADGSAPPA